MPKSSKLAPKLELKTVSLTDPRNALRIAMGVLLVANLAMAVVAFKPFGGSADDLRKDQTRLTAQLRQLRTKLEGTKDHVAKIKIARDQGSEFLSKYILQQRLVPEVTIEELTKAATESGVRYLPESSSAEPIEGSDDLQMVSITAGFEGTYAGLTKLVNTLEKSPHFLIIDSMNLNAPQQQQLNVARPAGQAQTVNVTMKILLFARAQAEALP